MFQDMANDRLSRFPAESLKCRQDSAVVGEHMNGSAACTRRHRPSIDGTYNHIDSHLDGSQCGRKRVIPCAAAQRPIVLALVIVATYLVDPLANTTNAN
jgi:hypothetical protein